VLLAWIVHAVLPASFTGAVANLPLWARMVAAMIVGEIGFYWVIAGATRSRCRGDSMRFITARPM
jgi:hypothetical protein